MYTWTREGRSYDEPCLIRAIIVVSRFSPSRGIVQIGGSSKNTELVGVCLVGDPEGLVLACLFVTRHELLFHPPTMHVTVNEFCVRHVDYHFPGLLDTYQKKTSPSLVHDGTPHRVNRERYP